MKFTNKFNLPETIVRAAKVQSDKYDKGHVHRSVTQLIMPPRIDVLRKQHFTEVTKDISEEWWALFGSAVHAILEMGRDNNQYVEERLFTVIDGWELSGAIDLVTINRHRRTLSLRDYKITTAFVVMKDEDGIKPEWEQQLNMLAFMATKNWGMPVTDVGVVAIIRDWQRTQAQADPLYPIAPVVPVNLPLWSPPRQEAFLMDRVALHRHAEMAWDLEQPLPECTDEERWSRQHTWAVIRDGLTKAAKVYYDEASAGTDLKERNTKLKKGQKPFAIQFRPGKSVRCEGNYCQVSQWCDQFARIKAEQPEEQPDEEQPAAQA